MDGQTLWLKPNLPFKAAFICRFIDLQKEERKGKVWGGSAHQSCSTSDVAACDWCRRTELPGITAPPPDGLAEIWSSHWKEVKISERKNQSLEPRPMIVSSLGWSSRRWRKQNQIWQIRLMIQHSDDSLLRIQSAALPEYTSARITSKCLCVFNVAKAVKP